MILLDSNIVIYSAEPENVYLLHFIEEQDMVVSIASYIEVLGFHGLEDYKKCFFEEFFQSVEILDLTYEIATLAVQLRQQRRMGLGDAIIAATALARNRTLVTHNTRDFQWITDLTLHDLIEQLGQS